MQVRAGADDRRAAHGRALEPRARLDRRRARRTASRRARRRPRGDRVEDRRLASSMSSRRPVSFHQPLTMCGSTRRPLSTRYWIASVISSSPRGEGSIARAASWMPRGEHVDADEREVGARLAPASRERARRDRRRARRRRSARDRATGVSRISASGALARKAATRSLMPPCEQVVAEVHDERVGAEERLGREHRVREAGGLVLDDVGDPHAELRAVADGLADLVAASRAR